MRIILCWILIAAAAAAASYGVGYQRGVSAWERQVKANFESLMDKLHPGATFEWEGPPIHADRSVMGEYVPREVVAAQESLAECIKYHPDADCGTVAERIGRITLGDK